jgi:hypothetical protein
MAVIDLIVVHKMIPNKLIYSFFIVQGLLAVVVGYFHGEAHRSIYTGSFVPFPTIKRILFLMRKNENSESKKILRICLRLHVFRLVLFYISLILIMFQIFNS